MHQHSNQKALSDQMRSIVMRLGLAQTAKSACNAGDPSSIPWRREWQPTPVFLPGEFYEQRNLARYCPWGRKELDTVERLTLTFTSLHKYFQLKESAGEV